MENNKKNNKMENKKIVLIGDSKVGKTSFVRSLLGLPFDTKWDPTLGVEVHPIRRGNICYNVWDCAGLYKFGGLRDGYWISSQGAIIMCDPTNLESIKNVEKWTKDIKHINENIHIVYVINKSDKLPQSFKDDRFVKISCLNNEGIENVLSKF